MIIFDGIMTRNKIKFIRFKNDQGSLMEIPIENLMADRIGKYLHKFEANEVPEESLVSDNL